MGYFFSRIEKYRKLFRRWWLTFSFGIVLLLAGILIFMFPQESYWAFSLFFGLMIMFSGFILFVAGMEAFEGSGRGWLITCGALEIILGLFIGLKTSVAATILPILLGLWLLYRGVVVVFMALDMKEEGVEGRGVVYFLAALLIISALLIIIFPAIGVGTIVIWLGLSFVLSGVSVMILGLHFRKIRKFLDI